jgi:hypothetical protein
MQATQIYILGQLSAVSIITYIELFRDYFLVLILYICFAS